MKLDVLQKQKSFTIDAIIGKDKETVDKKTETVSSACAQTASPVFQSCYSANLRRNLAASSLEIMRTLSSERNLFSGSWLIPPTTYPLSQFALGNIQQKLGKFLFNHFFIRKIYIERLMMKTNNHICYTYWKLKYISKILK